MVRPAINHKAACVARYNSVRHLRRVLSIQSGQDATAHRVTGGHKHRSIEQPHKICKQRVFQARKAMPLAPTHFASRCSNRALEAAKC